MITFVPICTSGYSSSISRLSIRMQPWEAFQPMEPGRLVPWMPYFPHGQSMLRKRVPKPVPQFACFPLMRNTPSGEGVAVFPTAHGQERISSPSR